MKKRFFFCHGLLLIAAVACFGSDAGPEVTAASSGEEPTAYLNFGDTVWTGWSLNRAEWKVTFGPGLERVRLSHGACEIIFAAGYSTDGAPDFDKKPYSRYLSKNLTYFKSFYSARGLDYSVKSYFFLKHPVLWSAFILKVIFPDGSVQDQLHLIIETYRDIPLSSFDLTAVASEDLSLKSPSELTEFFRSGPGFKSGHGGYHLMWRDSDYQGICSCKQFSFPVYKSVYPFPLSISL